MKRLIAIAVVWVGCAVAWIVLGATLLHRSGETSGALAEEVDELWGPPLLQAPPRASCSLVKKTKEKVTTTQNGTVSETEVERDTIEHQALPVVSSDLAVQLEMEHRRKGLLWFATYGANFRGRYVIANDSSEPREASVAFPLSAEHALYDGFRIHDETGSPVRLVIEKGNASFARKLEAGHRFAFTVHYRSRGRGSYQLADDTSRIEKFRLAVTTDFEDVDFPAGTLSPSRHFATPQGWQGEWTFDSLVSSTPIGIELPQKLNPGPLASRITFFAPVGLLFFFFVVAVVGAARGRSLHPMHYFLIGCAFFAFHLLFAYLVDHLSVQASFALASVVSVLLVVSYGRLFLGARAAMIHLGVPQFVYLVLFSGTFFWEGYTGLAVSIGAVLTLFVVMQITGRADWRAILDKRQQVEAARV